VTHLQDGLQVDHQGAMCDVTAIPGLQVYHQDAISGVIAIPGLQPIAPEIVIDPHPHTEEADIGYRDGRVAASHLEGEGEGEVSLLEEDTRVGTGAKKVAVAVQLCDVLNVVTRGTAAEGITAQAAAVAFQMGRGLGDA